MLSIWEEVLNNIERKYAQIFSEEESDDEVIFIGLDAFQRHGCGFRKAADLLADHLKSNHNGYWIETLPAILSLYRQSVELNLKSIRFQMARRLSVVYEFKQTHDLVELWNPIEDYLKSIGFLFEDGVLHYRVSNTVKEFSEVDRIGDRFRYPDSRHPRAHLGLWTNFDALSLSAAEVDLFSFGFPEIISHFQKAETNIGSDTHVEPEN